MNRKALSELSTLFTQTPFFSVQHVTLNIVAEVLQQYRYVIADLENQRWPPRPEGAGV